MVETQTSQKIGFSNGDTLMLFMLHETQTQPMTPTEIHELFHLRFPGKMIVIDYVARLAKKMERLGHLSLTVDGTQKFYQATESGVELLARYHDLYYGQFSEIFLVVERLYYDLTKNGKKPDLPVHPLPQDFRNYFSKLVSVKDVARYMIFKLGAVRDEFYIAEANEQMQLLLGWSPSNTYLYSIAREMEATGALKGYWKEPEKRTIRIVKVTEVGEVFAKQITDDLRHQITNTFHHLIAILDFIRKN